MPSGPMTRIKLSTDESIRQLLEARQSARWQWLNTLLWSRVFSFLHLGLVLATIGLGIAQTVYASRGQAALWPGIASTAVGSILALIRGTGLPDRVYEVLYDVEGWTMRCDQFTLKRSLRQAMSGAGGGNPDQRNAEINSGEEGREAQGDAERARADDHASEGGSQGDQVPNRGLVDSPIRTAATAPIGTYDSSLFWKSQGKTQAEDDRSAMEYSDALMADWARIMGRIQEVELGAWASLAGYGRKRTEGSVAIV